MNLTADQIENSYRIGTLGKAPVWMLLTKGGLSIVARVEEGKIDYLGMGNEPEIARHIARKKEPGLSLFSLTKSDNLVDPNGHVVLHYEKLTDKFRALAGRR